jgi:serine/threonine-protein kinase
MSFWSRVLARVRGPRPSALRRDSEPASANGGEPERRAVEDQVRVLQRLSSDAPPGAAVAVAALRAVRGRPSERLALDAVFVAHARRLAPEPVLLSAADLLVERGQPDEALRLLEEAKTPEALLLQADLRAARGEIAHAVLLVERVLARDIDAPGARERHASWVARMGSPTAERRFADEPTLIAAELPSSPFRILGEAGRGGAATVYEAVDASLGRRVALKVYHDARLSRDQLEREARVAVALAGRGIVRVFDADPGAGWIALEWLAGGALKRWLSSGSSDLLWPAARWVAPLIDAVARVHAQGLVHADLKPANVLFRTSDEPVLGDFGLARRPGERSMSGSFGYLSPERLGGEPLSKDDDVYALGRILEDALDELERADALPPAALARWRELVRSALAPRDRRPHDAAALRALVPG